MATKKSKKNVTKSKAAKKAKRAAPLARPRKASARKPKRVAASKGTSRKPTARTAGKAKSRPKKAVARSQPKGARAAVRRRDRPGHIDPTYAEELRQQGAVPDQGPAAFFDGKRIQVDDMAVERGEGVIEKATTGEDEAEDALDQLVPEEQGGPFVETNAGQEFAYDTDASNPKGSKREPFPTT